MAGWVAIIGLPPFSGFFSKDEILWLSFHSDRGHWALWLLGAIGALLTAFYMTRLMALTFWGKTRFAADYHPHESPWTMGVPLVVLAILAIFGGWLGIPHVISAILPGHPANLLEGWLGSLVHKVPTSQPASVVLEWSLMSLSVLGAMGAASLAFWMYIKSPGVNLRLAQRWPGVYQFINNKFYVDEFYHGKIINPLIKASEDLWLYVDVRIIDKTTHLMTEWSQGIGQMARFLQSGNIQTYALYVIMGLAIIISLVVTN
jgi:NADH-quinone oxidoreductase subunit L